MESGKDELKLVVLEDLNTRVQEILNSASMKSAFQAISIISASMRRIIPIHQEPRMMYIVRRLQKSLVEIRTYGQQFKSSPNEKFLLMILCSQG